MKPLLVGTDNPYQRDEETAMRYALHPDPPHASGGRLCHLIMGITERDYLRWFDRTDLCHPRWSLPAAREKAARLVGERTNTDVIVLCGSKVAQAFGVAYRPFSVHVTPTGPRLLILPHPSGLNRLWHAPSSVAEARSALRRAGVLPPLKEESQ